MKILYVHLVPQCQSGYVRLLQFTLEGQDVEFNKGQDRDKTGTRQGKDRDKIGTRQGRDREKIGTRQG